MKQEPGISNVIQRRQRLGNFCTGYYATHKPSLSVSVEVRLFAMQNTTTTLTHLSKRKKSTCRIFQTDDTITLNFRKADPRNDNIFIKEKLPKSTATTLVFKTKQPPFHREVY